MSSETIMSEQEKIIRFFDIFDRQDDYYCDTKINIKEIKYAGSELYYNISYTYEYSHNSLESHKANPFNYSSNSTVDRDGVIIIKNEMTTTMIKYLLMEPEELELLIGNTWVIQYKINIMNSLGVFWD